MNPTLSQVRADLTELLAAGPIEAIPVVYDHEQRRETTGPTWATIALVRLTADFQEWQIRLYASIQDEGAEAALTLDACLEGVDDRLVESDLWTAPDWEIGVAEDIACFVARANVRRGREDF